MKQDKIVEEYFDFYYNKENGNKELKFDFILGLITLLPLFKSQYSVNEEECRAVSIEGFAIEDGAIKLRRLIRKLILNPKILK